MFPLGVLVATTAPDPHSGVIAAAVVGAVVVVALWRVLIWLVLVALVALVLVGLVVVLGGDRSSAAPFPASSSLVAAGEQA